MLASAHVDPKHTGTEAVTVRPVAIFEPAAGPSLAELHESRWQLYTLTGLGKEVPAIYRPTLFLLTNQRTSCHRHPAATFKTPGYLGLPSKVQKEQRLTRNN